MKILSMTLLTTTLLTCLGITPPVLAASSHREQIITVTITDHGFSPAKIHVHLNEPVTLQIVNLGQRTHEWGLPEYRIFTADIPPKGHTTVSFSPWVQGTFPIVSQTSYENQSEFTAKFIVSSAIAKSAE